MITPDEQREALEPWAQVFHDRLVAEGRPTVDVHSYDVEPPDLECPECESTNLDDFDMDEDDDGHRWNTFTCLDCGFPNPRRYITTLTSKFLTIWANNSTNDELYPMAALITRLIDENYP